MLAGYYNAATLQVTNPFYETTPSPHNCQTVLRHPPTLHASSYQHGAPIFGTGVYQPSIVHPSKYIHPHHLRIECLHPPRIRQTITRQISTRPNKMLCQGPSHQLPLTTLHSPVLFRSQEISCQSLQIYPRIRARQCIRRHIWQPFQRRCKGCHLMRISLGCHFPVMTLIVSRALTPTPLLINHRWAQSPILLIILQPLIPQQRPRVVKGRQMIERTCHGLEVAR